MQLYALIVAGGTGTRMGTEIPKQFLELSGKPVLMHTIERFKSFDASIEIITVLPENQLRHWVELQEKYSFRVPHTLVRGGSARFFSVRNGLNFVSDHSLVAIHDGVRPCISHDVIRNCFLAAEELGNVVPAITPAESLRLVDKSGNQSLNRMNVRQIQTPQVFESGLIKNAYLQDYSPDFTDDATVLEKTGVKINLIEGNPENIKITRPSDLLIASIFLSAFK